MFMLMFLFIEYPAFADFFYSHKSCNHALLMPLSLSLEDWKKFFDKAGGKAPAPAKQSSNRCRNKRNRFKSEAIKVLPYQNQKEEDMSFSYFSPKKGSFSSLLEMSRDVLCEKVTAVGFEALLLPEADV
ncbi:hypothetical protein RB195_014913 [Necator americanus]|uniref:Uncharacterized protein n=1 Tax=Necator americanus TaxID=51031 RepID=A0ABR1E246_NECAM